MGSSAALFVVFIADQHESSPQGSVSTTQSLPFVQLCVA
jgi:hypothetical protein